MRVQVERDTLHLNYASTGQHSLAHVVKHHTNNKKYYIFKILQGGREVGECVYEVREVVYELGVCVRACYTYKSGQTTKFSPLHNRRCAMASVCYKQL